MKNQLSEQDFIDAAKIIGCEVEVIKAVSKVESGSNGFNLDDTPKILFEGHVFWRELKSKGIDPKTIVNASNYHILYEKWTKSFYGKTWQDEEKRFALALQINRDAALKSASWGKFQIMGFNFKGAGFNSVQDFVNAMYKSEGEQLKAFVNFVKSKGLDDELRRKDFAGFAKGYNGVLYKENKYDEKMLNAYNSFKKS